MPKVGQAHLDARRQQIVDAARARFARDGFARTSMADIVTESGLSTGAIYRYFKSKDELVVAVCEQASDALPQSLSPDAVRGFLDHVRALARDGHARLVTQVYAEAALNPALAAIVEAQLAALRTAVAQLIAAEHPDSDAGPAAEAFVAIGAAYNQQLAVRGDLDPAPYARALLAVIGE
jgi:AcrR family transcriptional regulator